MTDCVTALPQDTPDARHDAPGRLEVLPLPGMGEVTPGDDLVGLIVAAGGALLRDDDVVLVTSKVVSKAEGRLVATPADPAGREAARQAAIDAEAVRVVASRGATRIVQTRHGLVLAAAGVDTSNVDTSRLVLLPEDPDASARAIRAGLADRLGVRVAVVVTDTMGRTWRTGQTDVAIGAAGLAPLRDHRGQTDAYGNDLEVTAIAVIDELAAAGELVKGKTSGVPVAIVRGLGRLPAGDGPGAAALVRPSEDDMFALGTAEARAAGRLEMLAALRSGAGLADRPVPADQLRQAAGLALGTVGDPARWRFVHVASEAARKALAAVPGLERLRAAPAVLAVLRPDADPEAGEFGVPFAAAGLVLIDVAPRPDAGRVLDVPAGWRLAALYAVGYPADPVRPVGHDTAGAWVTR